MFVDIKTLLRFIPRFWVWRFSRIFFHIVFIVCVNKETKSFSQNLHPVDSMFELVDIRLVANLAGNDLLSEQIADRSRQTVKHSPYRTGIISQ